MKNLLLVSALTFVLIMCSHDAFSDEVLDSIFVDNHNNAKNLFLGIKNEVSAKGSRVKFAGNMVSYGWYSSADSKDSEKIINNNKRFNVDIGGNVGNIGAKHDGMLSLGIDLKPDKYGVIYGVYSQIHIPHVEGKSFGNNAAFNRGSKIFAKTPYGDFSVGYQEGIESIMKLNAFSVIAGDNYNIWTKHLRNILYDMKDVSGYFVYCLNFYSGLYSESFFRNSDNIVTGVMAGTFINNLPFRLSYQSQNFMGLRFGVSYSPFGYDRELSEMPQINFNNVIKYVEENDFGGNRYITMPYGGYALPLILIGPSYIHIISGGISYTYNFKNFKFSTSIIGEYGGEDVFPGSMERYKVYFKHHKLKGISVGWNIGYNTIEFAGSYGNLNRSGIPYARCSASIYCRSYWTLSEDIDYYWDIGIAYKYGDLKLSLIYFTSNRIGNKLNDISVGIEYNILRYNRFRNSVFANYHYYTFNQFEHDYKNTRNGKGSVLLVGTKLEF
ncbi:MULTISPECIES: porin [Ehrlichia]|uniref:Gram-negative porin family protein n=1 Tax=Ehrlichia cf. muris str. EmCRT TaxID=1359167 RepID=A0A0F3NCB5_9RICK|nr:MULTISPECIES: porin [Ehrlichia]KJV65367.1 gram-negative porin family protein [Ehrlichia cf. muris str. EmCRT]OUC04682.1 hypothetical protein DB91_00525 [Ehrlichia sp. Wisconsin_h]